VLFARVDSELDALILHVCELLAQLGILNSEGQELGSALSGVVHAVPYPA